MPSTTARAGGVFVPIINSLDKRTQAYLISQQLQARHPIDISLLPTLATHRPYWIVDTGFTR